MKKKDKRAYNSTLRPLSLKRQAEVASGAHKQKKRKAVADRLSIDELRARGKEAINRLLGEGKISTARALDREADRRMAKKLLSGKDSLSSLDGQLTTLFSRVIRLRATNHEGRLKCFICLRSVPYEEAVLMHYQGRIGRGTRFNEQACQAGCWGCNSKPNGDRKNYARRLNEVYGEGTSSRLDIMSKKVMNLDRQWYRDQIAKYSEELKQLQG